MTNCYAQEEGAFESLLFPTGSNLCDPLRLVRRVGSCGCTDFWFATHRCLHVDATFARTKYKSPKCQKKSYTSIQETGLLPKSSTTAPILHLCNKLYHNAINRDLDRFIYRNFIQAATKAGSELVIRVIKDDKIAGSST